MKRKNKSYAVDKMGNKIPMPEIVDSMGNTRNNKQPKYPDGSSYKAGAYQPGKSKTWKEATEKQIVSETSRFIV